MSQPYDPHHNTPYDPPKGSSRTTLEAQPVVMLKQYAGELNSYIGDYAGRSDKPTFIRDAVKKLVVQINDLLPGIVKRRSMAPNITQAWRRLYEEWDDGSGSLTAMKPYSQKFMAIVNDVEA